MWNYFAIAIATMICEYGGYFSHMALTNRPIFIGWVTGLLLGDMVQGILIGAQLELAFMGIVAIGATSAADPGTATIMTVAFSIMNNLPMETVIPLGMTIGYAATVTASLKTAFADVFVPLADDALSKDDEKKFKRVAIFGTMITCFLLPIAINIAGISIGGPALESLVNLLPEFVINGIGAAGAILPSLGIAMILTLVFNSRVAIYFFTGFAIYKYLEVDMIFMLIIGLLLAIIDFYYSGNKRVVEIKNEEEDFLS